VEAAGPALVGNWFVANNLVSLDNCRDADSGIAIFMSFVDSDYFSHRTDEHFGSSRDFRWQRQRDVELRPIAQVVINREVKAACGNVARFSLARGGFLFYWYPNDDRKRQIISTGGSTLSHFSLAPEFPSMYTIPDHDLGAGDVPN
jgi:hypothetical protein